jgi:hypothetical protein
MVEIASVRSFAVCAAQDDTSLVTIDVPTRTNLLVIQRLARAGIATQGEAFDLTPANFPC